MTKELVEMMMAEMTSEISNAVKEAVESHPWDATKIYAFLGSAIIDSAKHGGIVGVECSGNHIYVKFNRGNLKVIRLTEYVDEYVDEVGGIHGGGTGIAPDGVFCGECSWRTCKGCAVWLRRKKVRC